MKNNRPGSDKKTMRAMFTLALATAITLPLQGCNEDVPVAEPFDAAPVAVTREPVETLDTDTKGAVILGGRLYDNWIAESGGGSTVPTLENPIAEFMEGNKPTPVVDSPYVNFIKLSKGDQYRCTTCHGFDYLGSEFSDVGIMDAANNKTVEEIQAIIRDGIIFTVGTTTTEKKTTTVHDFKSKLSEAKISALAAFIKYGVVDIGDYFYAFGPISKGNAIRGGTLFDGAKARCSECHGTEGKTGTGSANEFVGTIGYNEPFEMLHKIRFGQPGELMPSIYRSDLTTQDAGDVMAYTQKLQRQ